MNIEELGYYKVADFILREPPARDECLKVVTRDADMHEFGDFPRWRAAKVCIAT